MAWTRFLLKSQDCDVRWLNQILLLPTTDRSGPLSARLAPRVFEDIHEKGKNPDGKYWMEFDDSGTKFNLVDRVCERVPNSREWLLRWIFLYLKAELPPLLHSRETLLAYLNQRELQFVPGRVIAAVRLRDPSFFASMKERSMAALVKAATPTTLCFILAHLREIIWRRVPHWYRPTNLAEHAIQAFIQSFEDREFDSSDRLKDLLKRPLQDAMLNIERWGDRCPTCVLPSTLEDLCSLPFLMERSQDLVDACDCLYASGEHWYERIGRPLPAQYLEGATEVSYLDMSSLAPSEGSVASALRILDASVSKVHERISGEYERSLLVQPGSNDDHRSVRSAQASASTRNGKSRKRLSSSAKSQ